MSMFSSFMHPGRGYDAAQAEMQKYYDQAQGLQQPFVNQGQDAYGGINKAMQNLLNPAQLQDEWNNSYTQSQSNKNLQRDAQTQGLDAASSMGLMGSRTAQDALQAGTTAIGEQGRQTYLDNLMQKYMAGTGIGQNIYGIGANAAGQMGQNAMNMGQNSAQTAFGSKNAGGSLFGNMLGSGVGLVGSALGGPMGGALAKRWNLSGGK